ncbi:MAG TPA: CpsB/CapC family capsule biosynthesis tyrosine phosphatase [Solirubrobacteraceae bacterium]|nr:CpsB/CapC family capsule biosynthesis tyrosine phosphatase [Solirubrobacteraceae bacterium]
MRTELHFHLLPGVDDGPNDDAEAIDLARLAVEDGTGRVVVTPHVRLADIESLTRMTQRLQAALRGAGIDLELHAGGELSPDDVASLEHAQLELLAHGPPDERWLLLEAPLFSGTRDLDSAAAELRDRGFGVLIGHPERSPVTPDSVIRGQVARGAVLQINASSLTGAHGAKARRRGISLARSGLPFLLASDAHSAARPPQLTPAGAALLAAGLDEATIRAAVDVLPEAILTDGLAAARSRRSPAAHGGRSRLGQRERAASPVARAAQILFDRRRGT